MPTPSRSAFPPITIFVFALLGMALQGCRFNDLPTREGAKPGSYSLAVSGVPASFNETVVATLTNPTAMAMAPDGRLFVCQQAGQVRIVKAGSLSASPFLTVPVNSEGERGLLGLAFDPDFATTGYVYIYYTATSPVHNRVSRFTASASNPDTVIAGSETILLDMDNLGATNHNGGGLRFGPDGALYIASGDNAIGNNSQSMANLLGKMLRINKDGSIPTDNPFYATATGNNRAIWAYGLRNPFTFDFQPGTTRMYISEVGLSQWEEINVGAKGANYGWPLGEGPSANSAYTNPLLYYRNAAYQGTGPECAIVGAAFYNPAVQQFPAEYQGDFFYGDHCAGWIRSMDVPGSTSKEFATGIRLLTGLLVGNDGALYYASQYTHQIVKITYSSVPLPPQFLLQPKPVTVNVGGSAAFTVSASGDGPISYRWQRDSVNIAGTAGSGTTLNIAPTTGPDSGAQFRCIATNANGSDTSDEVKLHVTVNKPPVAAITLPNAAYKYRAGDTLAYTGTGTDPEDGTLAAGAFTWQIDFHHGTHFHPYLAATTGSKTGKSVIPIEGEIASDVWLRIFLTVVDSKGLKHKDSLDVQPVKSAITIATVPPGLEISLDGSPDTSPVSFTGVAGMRRIIRAASHNFGGKTYEFVSWSDSGASEHSILTPLSARTYTATFREILPNKAPVASITGPDTSFRYQAGKSLAFSATASDPEDGALPDSAFSWKVDFHHDTHVHSVGSIPSRAKSGSFTVPSDGEVSVNVFYRISLTVTDKAGLTHSVSRDVPPLKTVVTLASKPSGLKVQLDGATVTTPFVFTGVAGVRRSITTNERQDLGTVGQDFVSWSDSGAVSHFIYTPSSADTITALFKERPISTGIRPGNIMP